MQPSTHVEHAQKIRAIDSRNRSSESDGSPRVEMARSPQGPRRNDDCSTSPADPCRNQQSPSTITGASEYGIHSVAFRLLVHRLTASSESWSKHGHDEAWPLVVFRLGTGNEKTVSLAKPESARPPRVTSHSGMPRTPHAIR